MASKAFRVWTNGKQRGKLISANKLDEMLIKIRTKFELEQSTPVTLVLSDGCQVDDDESFETLETQADIFFLENNDSLNLPGPSSTNASNLPANNNLLDLVKKIRLKKTSLNKQDITVGAKKARRSSVKLSLGWLIQMAGDDRYSQVRMASGGGARLVEFESDSDYAQVMTKAGDLFFPDGKSSKGNLNDFDCVLGDFKQNVIISQNFSVDGYVKKHCLTSKPRIYFMTKAKAEEDDWDLPDIDEMLHSNNFPRSTVEDSGDGIEDFQIPSPPENNRTTGTENVTSADITIPNLEERNGMHSNMIDLSDEPNVSTPEVELLNSDEGNSEGTRADLSAVFDLTAEHLPQVEMEMNSISDASPVTIRYPPIPTCAICSDRYSDTFLTPCGHILCAVCAAELEERNHKCHICRNKFIATKQLFY